MKDKKLHMIGNAHLDPVWLWNWQEGFQEVKATFRSALDRMNEDENFVFTCSSAAFYEWVEHNNPQMFEEIKKRVAEGRWEIVGGWWIQPDCNIPSGEAFARQGLYGQRYFKEKLNTLATTGYNVDSFGHNGNLPQILKKSGLDNYVFMRPMPLEKGLPGRTFWWKSMDGSSVMTYRIPYEYCSSRLLFVAELPSMGYEVFRLYLKAEDAPRFPHVKVTDNMLENARYRISFDEATGYLASLYDKQSDLEVLRREGARLAVIEDLSDTWSHNIFKFDKHLGDMKAVSRTVLEDGPVRSTVRIKYKYNTSYVVQDFRLYSELDYVEVRVRVDWREPQTILKIKYPVNFNFRKPTYEIPYGYIEKSANGEEEPGQTWFDFSGEHFQKGVMYGLAIANNAKYSYSFDVDEMNLTVLKNSVYAHHDPKKLEDGVEYEFVDDGIQEFMYMLLPHTGGWKDSEIVKHARELNQKPVTIIETFHKGSLPARNSFLSMESDNVVISAMKEAEDGDGVIIRAYETKRQASQALLKIPFLNREETLSFAPCEIKTVKLPYDHSAPVMEVNLLEM